MSRSADEVRGYYDAHVAHKIRDFIEGNERVEKAFQTIARWAGEPSRVLEIGCGIGQTCWRMSRLWPEAEVIGLDISPASLKVARALFRGPRVSFLEGPLAKDLGRGPFDLIVLMDVYEHIAVPDRPGLHEAIKGLRASEGRVILAFPTPRKQAWLREHRPEGLQPVDEDIDLDVVRELARDTGTDVLLFQEIDVWNEGDYAHAALGTRSEWRPSRALGAAAVLRRRARELIRPVMPPRAARLNLVRRRLGPSAVPASRRSPASLRSKVASWVTRAWGRG